MKMKEELKNWLEKINDPIRNEKDVKIRRIQQLIDYYSKGMMTPPKSPARDVELEIKKINEILKPEKTSAKALTLIPKLSFIPFYLPGFQKASNFYCFNRYPKEFGTTGGTLTKSPYFTDKEITNIDAAAYAFGYDTKGVSFSWCSVEGWCRLPPYANPTDFRVVVNLGAHGVLAVLSIPSSGIQSYCELKTRAYLYDYDSSASDWVIDGGLGGKYRKRGSDTKSISKSAGFPELHNEELSLSFDVPKDAVPFPKGLFVLQGEPGYWIRIMIDLLAVARGNGSYAFCDFANGANKITVPLVYAYTP